MKMQPKNVHTDGGDTWIIGGKLVVEDGAAVEGLEAGGGLPEGGTNGQVLKIVADAPAWAADTNTTYTSMTAAQATAGSATTAQTISAKVLADAIVERPTPWADVTGKPSTFAPTIGNTATTAKAGNAVQTATQTTATAVAPGTATNVQAILVELSARIAALESA